jgi:hypothetical protein
MEEFVVSLTEHYLKPTLELIGIVIVLLGCPVGPLSFLDVPSRLEEVP